MTGKFRWPEPFRESRRKADLSGSAFYLHQCRNPVSCASSGLLSLLTLSGLALLPLTFLYQRDHILLEFGGRNRGKPTNLMPVVSYLSGIAGMDALQLPAATVNAYDTGYIL